MAETQTSSAPAWKPALETAGTLRFIKPKELADSGFTGVVAQGTFLKAQASEQYPDNPAYYIDLAEALPDGTKTVAINSCGSLANQMKGVKPGTLVQVIYNGMKKSKSGRSAGKQVHEFKVNIA